MIRAITIESGGTMVAVDDAEIREAQAHVLEDEGIAICPAAATAVAALAKLARTNDSLADQKILVNLTGSTRENGTPGPIDAWWERGPMNWNDPDRAIGVRFEPGVGGRQLALVSRTARTASST